MAIECIWQHTSRRQFRRYYYAQTHVCTHLEEGTCGYSPPCAKGEIRNKSRRGHILTRFSVNCMLLTRQESILFELRAPIKLTRIIPAAGRGRLAHRFRRSSFPCLLAVQKWLALSLIVFGHSLPTSCNFGISDKTRKSEACTRINRGW